MRAELAWAAWSTRPMWAELSWATWPARPVFTRPARAAGSAGATRAAGRGSRGTTRLMRPGRLRRRRRIGVRDGGPNPNGRRPNGAGER
jgi:hypothetical protein